MTRYSNYRVAQMLEQILVNQEIIMSGLDDLKAAVAKEATVEAGAVTLIQKLTDELRNVPPNDDAALKALADQLTQATQPLANALVANTAAAGGGSGAAGAGATGAAQGSTGVTGAAAASDSTVQSGAANAPAAAPGNAEVPATTGAAAAQPAPAAGS